MNFIESKNPAPNEVGVPVDTSIKFDIISIDGYTLSIDAYVDSSLVYDGSSFFNPFLGSSVNFSVSGSIDGYDAYQYTLNKSSNFSFSQNVSVRVVGSFVYNTIPLWGSFIWGSFLWGSGADGYGNIDETWTFKTEPSLSTSINKLYFSDGYGLKSIQVVDLVGESQAQVSTILSSTTFPSIQNEIKFINGKVIDDYSYLVLSYDSSPGIAIVEQESNVTEYLDGYKALKGQITSDGTLYVVNADLNQIEVYYGANYRTGVRSPDYIYNTTSTPSIFGGTILDLHIVDDKSSVLSGGTRFYVGTTLGATRVETYDKNTDGYSDGYDSYGISFTYGISGSGAQYEVIGGTISECVEVSSDDDRYVMIVGTSDGYGDGGLTQISISGNRKIFFMNKSSGLIPSNTINDIFGKAL